MKNVPSLKQRRRIIERADGLCEICGALAATIHHKGGKGMGGTTKKFEDEDLIALCLKCHQSQHGLR